jgi:deoxyribodipyrimidine photolyase-related protein
MKAGLVFPHQLYEDHPVVAANCSTYFIIEEPLLFRQYAFHLQKLVLHRASMKSFAQRLARSNKRVHYVDSSQLLSTGEIGQILAAQGVTSVAYVDPCDDWLASRLAASLRQADISARVLPDPNFLTDLDAFAEYTSGRKKWFFTDFYIAQRKRLGILLEENGKPTGGKWSFDSDNRKKLPKDVCIPTINWPQPCKHVSEAQSYAQAQFPNNPGSVAEFRYPVDHSQAQQLLADFIENRLEVFGDYEDSIEVNEAFLFHSVLTPALNTGLLSPLQVVEAVLKRSSTIPLNSLEGFVRQVIGWREYMRGVYYHLGKKQRSLNYWDHQRTMPAAMYTGSTGIEPVDTVIQRLLKYSYCHHIERLMVLGNFMLLCEIHPRAIYQWFMELFIDAYDWVMVPNVYGMSQHADGGLITTKPYISGSAYLLKMSSFKKGPWCAVWDALYWRFIDRHRPFFRKNPRMSVMVSQCDRLGDRLIEHHRTAEKFLERLK